MEKLEAAKTTDDPAEVFMLSMEALAALQAEKNDTYPFITDEEKLK